MRIAITGAAGFIGSHVAAILAQHHEILAIDDLSGGFPSLLPPGIRFEKISTCDPLDNLFHDFKPNIIYHLAAYAAEGLSHHIPLFNYRNNLDGTVNVLAAGYRSGMKHFVFTSSIAVYGHSHGSMPFDEDTLCAPCDPYGVAKLACEYHIKSFCNYFKRLSYTILRPHNVFGPHQNVSDPYRNVVGIFIASVLKNQPMPIFGDGSQTRNFSYINTVADAIAQAPFMANAKNQIFNIGGDESMTVLELAYQIAKVAQVKPDIEFLPARNEVMHAHSDHARAHQVFKESYDQGVDIATGLHRMFQYVRQHPIPEPTPCPSAIEIIDDLPISWKKMIK